MTRRLRSKTRKYAGNRTFGGGNKKNRRGKGSRGGVGHAGFHKHKWFHTIKYELADIIASHKGFHNQASKKTPVKTLEQINRDVTNGVHKVEGGVAKVNLPNYKVIGGGPLDHKIELTAKVVTENAQEKITSLGGKVTVVAPKEAKPAEAKPVAKPQAKK